MKIFYRVSKDNIEYTLPSVIIVSYDTFISMIGGIDYGS